MTNNYGLNQAKNPIFFVRTVTTTTITTKPTISQVLRCPYKGTGLLITIPINTFY